jgi:putative transposase
VESYGRIFTCPKETENKFARRGGCHPLDRQVLVDTMGLVCGVLVHAANGSDTEWGSVLVIEAKGVLKRVKKVLVDMGYTGPFHQACMDHLGALAEVSSKPPSEKGFVPVKWRWVSERTFGTSTFTGG